MQSFKTAPEVQVGIMTSGEIRFGLTGTYSDMGGTGYPEDIYIARISKGKISVEANGSTLPVEDGLLLQPEDRDASWFKLFNVTIGIGFHWQKNEDQKFRGGLKLIAEKDKIIAVNVVSVEDYLVSVISSEMKATSSMQMLMAHAVISRSWLLAQTQKGRELREQKLDYHSTYISDNEIVRWYDREDHSLFDVCADDHCQRYQGITRASTPLVEKAVHETRGEVLVFDGKLCDARFAKCCGGVTELFENAWEPVNHPYLQKVYDHSGELETAAGDLTSEEAAFRWIMSSPEAFCNTNDKRVLSQVLNDYDQETNDFYRWKVSYAGDELGDLIKRRTGIDFGKIVDLVPLQRGVSGRLIRLKIVGTTRTMIIGKELEIRKALSETHLYSSAFVVEKAEMKGKPGFILHGAGWGHGVGLCQIGAAMMGEKGYDYKQILMHYYRGAKIKSIY